MSPPQATVVDLQETLAAKVAAGGRCLVPYVTAGLPGWTDAVRAVVDAGADAVEIGVPFSDPVMDGSTIQVASEQALRAGANPPALIAEAAGLEVEVPLAVMTYYNIAFRMGHERFARSLRSSGIGAAILPDLPLEEAGPWAGVADEVGIATVMLVAPTTPDGRLRRIVDRCRGFVYAVGLLGVTGERTELAASARRIAARARAVATIPVLVGVGVSTPEQAVEVCEDADGVVVGSAVVRRFMDEGPTAAGDVVAGFRRALDGG